MYNPRIDFPPDQDTGKIRAGAQGQRTEWPVVGGEYPQPGGDFTFTHVRHVKAANTTVTHVNALEPVEVGWALPPGGSGSMP